MPEEEFDFAAAMAEKFQEKGLGEYGEPEADSEPEPAPAPEPEAQPEPEPEPEPEVEAKPERERNELGQFVAKDSEPILGKFKSQEDLVAAYQQLEQRLGQTGEERRELNELREHVAALQQAEQRRSSAPSDWGELIEENPAYATKLAYQQQNQAALRAAAAAWEELSPGAPELWAQNLAMQQRLEQMQQSFQQQMAPVQEQTTERDFVRVVNEIASAHPDFDKYADQIAEVANSAPEVVGILQKGDYDSKKRVVESLYWMARGRASDNLAAAAQEAAQQQTDEARARKAGAVVASASTAAAASSGDAISRFTQGIVDAAGDLY